MAPSVLERICRHADGWLARAAGSTDSVIADWAQIQRRLEEIGRPPGSITFGHVNFVHVVRPTTRRRRFGLQWPLIERVMGTHRSFDHLRASYLLGTRRRSARASRTDRSRARYLALSPLDYDVNSSISGGGDHPHFRPA